MERLIIPRRLYDRMVEHSRCESPLEAVGLIGGRPSGEVVELIALPNASGPGTFIADPYSQFRAEKRLKEAGLVVVGVYHSHPGGGAQLSETDQHFAAKGLVHVVISFADSHSPDVKVHGYRVTQSAVADVPILVGD